MPQAAQRSGIMPWRSHKEAHRFSQKTLKRQACQKLNCPGHGADLKRMAEIIAHFMKIGATPGAC